MDDNQEDIFKNKIIHNEINDDSKDLPSLLDEDTYEEELFDFLDKLDEH